MSNVLVESLAGGALIGLGTTVLLLGSGRIAGISGIVANLLAGDRGERQWRVLFVAGLAGAPLLWWLATGSRVAGEIQLPVPLLILAGLLVGFGTRRAAGCTSGHGVCGLGNLSARSLVAVVTFMAVAAATVFVARHLLGV